MNEQPMTTRDIIAYVIADYSGVVPKETWGETSLFYNPGRALPNGVYFCTLKEKDGKNDRASQLVQPDVFRLSVGVSPQTYEARFGPRPPRPPKGGVVETGHDFTQVNVLMPHPVYAWMGWVCILSPTADMFAELRPWLDEAYRRAVTKFEKKVG